MVEWTVELMLKRKYAEWINAKRQLEKETGQKLRMLPYPALVGYFHRRKDDFTRQGGDPDIFDDAFADIDISVASDSWYDLDGELQGSNILAAAKEEYDLQRMLAEEFQKVIEIGRNASIPERQIRSAAEEAGIPIERIQRVKGIPKEEYDRIKAQLEKLKKRFGEIRPVGPPRTVPVAPVIGPPPIRITAVEARAERLVEQIGKRILDARDYYSALGVPRDAKTEYIIDTTRLLISTYHPDVYPKPEANEITRKLIEIRDVLTDPARRKDYDRQFAPARPPTVEVAVGQPVIYCTDCQKRGRGLVMMNYTKTLGPYKSTGRTYDIYQCPDPTCKKDRIANFFRGQFIGFGK